MTRHARWILATILATSRAFASDASTFAIEAPPEAGVYRLRPSAEASNRWALAALTSAQVFDNAGERLPCSTVSSDVSSSIEMMYNSWLAKMDRSYPIEGRWLDANERAAFAAVNNFRIDAALQFSAPVLEQADDSANLEFDWHSDAPIDKAEMQLIQVADGKFVGRNALQTMLCMQYHFADSTDCLDALHKQGQIIWGAAPIKQGHQIASFAKASGEWQLRLHQLPAGFGIEHLVAMTHPPRPWVGNAVDAPGWILFQGNGRTPYSIRFSKEGPGAKVCGIGDGGLMKKPSAAQFAQPDWPPEAQITHEVATALQVDFLADPRKRSWAIWSIVIAGLFILAAAAIFFSAVQRRRKS